MKNKIWKKKMKNKDKNKNKKQNKKLWGGGMRIYYPYCEGLQWTRVSFPQTCF